VCACVRACATQARDIIVRTSNYEKQVYTNGDTVDTTWTSTHLSVASSEFHNV